MFLSILKNQISELKRDKTYQDLVRNEELVHNSDLASNLMVLIYHTVIEKSSSRYHQITEHFFGNQDDYEPEDESQPDTLCDRIFGAQIHGVVFNLIDADHVLLVGPSEVILVDLTK